MSISGLSWGRENVHRIHCIKMIFNSKIIFKKDDTES